MFRRDTPAKAYHAYESDGLPRLAERGAERALFREPTGPLGLYWRLAPRYYRYHVRRREFTDYEAPLDPFKLETVDPTTIRRHTRREYPPYRARFDRFGTVAGGDWDRRDRPPVDPDYEGSPPELFVDERLTETVLYRSLEDRFARGEAWTETELYEEVCSILDRGIRAHAWHGCRSREDVLERFAALDELYARIRDDGYVSQRERQRRIGGGFRDALREEVAVDVGRDGELLLVCGKHRYCIARILGLEELPVVFLVRHPEWMSFRDACYERDLIPDHPDLRELRARSS